MKTIKIIDLLNKIANGENAPNTIRINEFSFIFNSYTSIDCYYTEESSNKFWLSFMSIDLTDEVEILDSEDEFEDEFEDTRELTNYKIADDTFKGLLKSINGLNNDFTIEINKLIKNQKKIIERLNDKNE